MDSTSVRSNGACVLDRACNSIDLLRIKHALTSTRAAAAAQCLLACACSQLLQQSSQPRRPWCAAPQETCAAHDIK